MASLRPMAAARSLQESAPRSRAASGKGAVGNRITPPKDAKTANPPDEIDLAAISNGVYWTLWRTGGIPNIWGMKERPQLVPHEGLCKIACKSPAALLRLLKSKGWKTANFNHSEDKIVRVVIIGEGFNVTSFETYKAACLAAGGVRR